MSVNPNSVPSGLIQPAQQTTLGNEGHGFLPRTWYPNTGLVLRANLRSLPPDACSIASNVRWNGVVWTTSKIGWSAVRGTPFGNGPIVEQAKHFTTAGAQLYVHQAGTMVQTYDPANPTVTETNLFTASAQSVPCMRSFSPNFFIYVNGQDLPQFWDGTVAVNAFKPLACFPFLNGGVTYDKPTICEPFLNRMTYAGFKGNPFAVVIGNFGDPSTITIINGTPQPTQGGIFFVPSQLGPVTWLKYLQTSLTSNSQVLLVGCQNGFAFISGSDATSFVMVPVQSDKWGCPSNRVCFTIDTTVWNLCSDGLRPFNGNAYQSNLISTLVTRPVHPLVTSWDSQNQGSQAFVLDNATELEATFYFSKLGDTINRTGMIMNYSDMPQGLVRFSEKDIPSGSFLANGTQYSPACGIKFKGRYFGGGWDGLLQEHYTSSLWNGVGAKYMIESSMLASNTPLEESTLARMAIEHQSCTSQMTVRTYTLTPQAAGSQQLRRTAQTPQTLNFVDQGSTSLGKDFALGKASFGGPQYQISPFSSAGGGRGMQVNISGNTANGDLNLIGTFNLLIGGGTRQ